MDKAKILIVDDSPVMRDMLREQVSQAGYEVVGEASDAEQALFNFKALEPHVVLMDLIMPGDSGLVALKNIRAHDPAAAVIMVTAVGQERVVKQALSIGASGFLRKPFGLEELKAAIQQALHKEPAAGHPTLSDHELRMLQKLVNAGIQGSVQALARLYKTRWSLSASSFHVGSPEDLRASLEGGPIHSGVLFSVPGGIPLACLVVFPPEGVGSLVDNLAGLRKERLGSPEEAEEWVLGEVGNILANTFLETMGNYYITPLLTSVPHFHRGPRSHLLGETLASVKAPDDSVLMCHVHLRSEKLSAECLFLCVFSVAFVGKLLQDVK